MESPSERYIAVDMQNNYSWQIEIISTFFINFVSSTIEKMQTSTWKVKGQRKWCFQENPTYSRLQQQYHEKTLLQKCSMIMNFRRKNKSGAVPLLSIRKKWEKKKTWASEIWSSYQTTKLIMCYFPYVFFHSFDNFLSFLKWNAK